MASSITTRLGTTPNESVKSPVVAATTANITLSGEQTIDGVAVVAGDRVLVKNQTTGAENGIYDVSVTSWSRSSDWDTSGDVVNGTVIHDTNDGVLYTASFTGTFALDSTTVTFSALPGTNYSAIVDDIPGLIAASTSAQLVTTRGYHTPGDREGRNYWYDSTGNKNTHNGGTIIDPDVTFPSDWTNQTQVTAWFTAGTGTGVWKMLYSDSVTVKDFGAKGDGAADDTKAVQKTLDEYKSVHIPVGTYECDHINITTDHFISGEGKNSKILSVSTTSAFSVDASAGIVFLRLKDFSVHPSVVGSGTYGIDFVLAGASGYISNWEVSGVEIGDFGSYGFHFNNDLANANGFFTGTLRRSWITNGINGSNIGDSITIAENTITGDNTGILVSVISGARQIVIRDNNITTQGGGLALLSAGQAQVYNNQIEHPAYIGNYTGAYDAMVYLSNCFACVIRDNTISTGAATIAGVNYNILMDGTTSDTLISGNVLTKGELYHVGTGVSALGNMVAGDNTYDETPANLLQAVHGAGFDLTLTPLNSWVAYAGDTDIKVHKDVNNNITVRGALKSGTTAAGTALATLPVGFRPLSQKRFQVTNYDGAAYSSVTLLVSTAGSIDILSSGVNNTLLHLDGVAFNEYS